MAKKANIGATIGLDGEKAFKQAISSINSDMKVLGSEMKKVTSSFVANEKSVESLTAQDKVLRQEQTLQVKKLAEVQQALIHAKNTYGDTDKRTKEWQITLNNTQAELNGMNRKLEDNKDALNKAQNPTEALAKDVKKFGDNAEVAGKHSLKMGDIIKANLISGAIISGVKALASALVGVAKQTYDMVQDTIDSTSEIADNSKKVGMSAVEYQKWTYAAKQSGLEQDALTSAMIKQQTAFAKATAGSKEQAKSYKDLGVEIKGLTSSQAFDKAIKALSEMKSETEQNRLANELFGKSYAELKPLLAEGADGIEKLRQKAVDLGGVMSNESVAAGEKLGDTIDDLKFMFSGVANEIITSFMPELQKIADWVLANKDKIKEFGTDVIGKIADGFQWFADNKDNIAKAFDGILKGLIGFSDNKDLIVVAVLGIAGAFTAAAIAAGAFHSAWSIGINAAFIVAGIYAISAAIDAVTGKASKRPVVTKASLGTTGTSYQQKATLGTGSLPTGGSVTQTGYSRHALGGIFDKPTLFRTPGGYHEVGEKGMEAVMPLAKLPGLLGMENLADNIATAIDRKMRNMVVVLDGDRVGSFVDARLVKAGQL